MKKKILVRGPALSRSGYGEHVRMVLRSLKTREDLLDIYLMNTGWGRTGWNWEDNETIEYTEKQNTGFDISIQVTIPNEFERMAPINIGVTAGIETTKVSPHWIEKSQIVDKIIVVSNHSKQIYENTVYEATNKETGEVVKDFRCNTPISVVHYPVRDHEPIEIDLDLEYDFNFLTVAQISPRKNMENTIIGFVEEFMDEEVGLVVKCNIASDSSVDREYTKERIKDLLSQYENRKCKVYLLHGTMKEGEMTSLYNHPKIKAYVSIAHGEGFGLPIFEAAYSEIPVIAPDWSGHCDFLYAPVKDKKTKKEKMKAHFSKVKYTMKHIPKEVVWDGVIQEDSMWCYPDQKSYKNRLREIYKTYGRFKSRAKKLNKYIRKNFSEEAKYSEFVQHVIDLGDFTSEEEVTDMFDRLFS